MCYWIALTFFQLLTFLSWSLLGTPPCDKAENMHKLYKNLLIGDGCFRWLTWGFEFSEIYISQNKVDNCWTIYVRCRILGFEDIALLQPLTIKHVWVYFGKWKFVHFGPFFSKQNFLGRKQSFVHSQQSDQMKRKVWDAKIKEYIWHNNQHISILQKIKKTSKNVWVRQHVQCTPWYILHNGEFPPPIWYEWKIFKLDKRVLLTQRFEERITRWSGS